jgi:CheY-like chemotaxis protein
MSEFGPTILIADDDTDILWLTAKVLRACGYTVLTAKDGEMALKTFEQAQHPIEMIISDVMMPRMRGTQLVQAIKGLSPSTATLLMSGSWRSDGDGGVALVRKPFTQQEFLAVVRDMLAACDFEGIEREQSLARSRRIKALPDREEAQPREAAGTNKS